MPAYVTLKTQLIPVAGLTLLLPNTAVAELVPYEGPKGDGSLPDWVLGTLEWRGKHIPVISFEAAIGREQLPTGRHCRLVIFNTTQHNSTLPFFAALTQGIPQLRSLKEEELVPATLEHPHEFILARALYRGDSVIIPDLNRIEQRLQELGLGA